MLPRYKTTKMSCYDQAMRVVYLSLCEPTMPEYKGSNLEQKLYHTISHCIYCTVFPGCRPMFSGVKMLGEFENDC